MQVSNKQKFVKQFSANLLVIILLLALGACTIVQKFTYPQNRVSLDNDQVHVSMKEMAMSLNKINQVLDQTISPQSRKSTVIEELDSIFRATENLGTNASISNHRIISDNIGSFKEQVSLARKAVETNLPDYNLAGRLAERCLDCHYKNITTNSTF